MDQKKKLRIVGLIALAVFATGVGYLLAYGVSKALDSWIYVLIIGVAGVLGLEFLILPERFLPDRVRDRAG